MIMDNFDSPFQYNRPEMTVEAIKNQSFTNLFS